MNLGKPVTPGQKLAMPADLMNVLRRMAQDYLAGDATGAGPANGNADRVLVRNDSGDTVSRFGILGIDGVLYTPDDDLVKFQTAWALKGVTPAAATHRGKFVVMLDGVPKDKIGRALLAGNTPVQVNVKDEKHAFADIADDDATQLESCGSGGAQILYKPSGTGTLWALVRLGVPPPSTRRVKVTAFAAGNNGRGTYTVSEVDMAGNVIGSDFDKVENVMEDSDVDGIYDEGDITTLFCGADGVWYLDSGREVLR